MRGNDRRHARFRVVLLGVHGHAAGRDDLERLQRCTVHDRVLRRPVRAGDRILVLESLVLRGLDGARLESHLDFSNNAGLRHEEVDQVDLAVAADGVDVASGARHARDVHRVAGLDHLDDLLGVAIHQRDLTAVAQRHDEDVVDVVVVLLGRRPVLDRHHDGPAGLDLLHAELGWLRRLVLHVARHQVDLLRRQLAGLAPARHAGGRALVDEDLEVFGALFLRDVGRQRLAGRAFAQHAVTTRAALEVDLLRLLELGLGHVRCAGRHENLDALGASGRRCALVLELGRGGRMLRRRVGLFRGCRRLRAHGSHLRRRNSAGCVAPRVHRVGQCVRDLLVGELRHRGHDGVELGVVHDYLALQPVHDHADRAILVLQQVVRSGERREGARQALAVGLVAGHAGDLECLLALGDLGCDGRGARDLGLMDLLRPGRPGQCERTGDGERDRRPGSETMLGNHG